MPNLVARNTCRMRFSPPASPIMIGDARGNQHFETEWSEVESRNSWICRRNLRRSAVPRARADSFSSRAGAEERSRTQADARGNGRAQSHGSPALPPAEGMGRHGAAFHRVL